MVFDFDRCLSKVSQKGAEKVGIKNDTVFVPCFSEFNIDFEGNNGEGIF